MATPSCSAPFTGFSALAYRDIDRGADHLLESLLWRAGAESDRCGRLLRRRRAWQGRAAWFFINPTAKPVTEKIAVDGFRNVSALLDEDSIKRDGESFWLTVPGAQVSCVLLDEGE